MKLHIKYMVSLRCKMVVKDTLEKFGLTYRSIELGEADIFDKNVSDEMHTKLKTELLKYGLELIDDKRAILIDSIKKLIIEMIHYDDELPTINISHYISENLHHDYTYLSNLFSEVTGTTISQFILLHKIERIKELILYDELNLTEISYKLNYSSVAHLSNQFKKMTGLTPTYFKKINDYKKRIMLETI